MQAWQDMKAADHEAALVRSGRIYLPGSAPRAHRIFEGHKREHIINQVQLALSHWRSTKFENEAACRHGLRSALCSQGHLWALSDAEAEKIVLEALHRMGARRPTWEQGQPGYVEAEDNCRWCGQQLPEEMAGTRRAISFCSEEHALLARQHWGFEHRRQDDRTFMAVVEAVYRAKAPVRECAHCGKGFKSHKPKAKYCSSECSGLATMRHEAQCDLCGTRFRSQSTDVRFCSAVCRTRFNQLQSGKWAPKRLSPVVFDFFILLPLSARPPWATPARFDALLEAA